jgi:DHA1 family inner membrane transport protein
MTLTDPASVSARSRAGGAIPVMAGFLLCIFAIGTAEFLIAGLLPQVAADMKVSVAAAGQTVTAYAVGVVIGGPLVTMMTARLPRKGLTLGLIALFIVGTAVSASAASYEMLLTGRVVAALSQGTLYAIALIVVTTVVPAERAGRAIAVVVSGLTFATLLGVPLGALVGERFGWQAPIIATGVIAAVGGALLAVAMPRQPAPATGIRDELRVLMRRPVVLAIATTAVGFAGVGTVFTYIAPLLTQVTGFAASTVSALLLAYGAGSVLGNLGAGRLTDISPAMTLRIVFVGLMVLLAVMPFAATWPPTAVIAVLALGLLSTATVAPLQRLLLSHAGDAPTLAVAVNVGGFNLATAIGSAIGDGIVAAGALRWNGLAGAVLTLFGLALSFLAVPTPTARSKAPTPRSSS